MSARNALILVVANFFLANLGCCGGLCRLNCGTGCDPCCGVADPCCGCPSCGCPEPGCACPEPGCACPDPCCGVPCGCGSAVSCGRIGDCPLLVRLRNAICGCGGCGGCGCETYSGDWNCNPPCACETCDQCSNLSAAHYNPVARRSYLARGVRKPADDIRFADTQETTRR